MKKNIEEQSGNRFRGKSSSRREFINNSMGGMALIGAAANLGKSEEKNSPEKTKAGKLKVIVAGGHPGDPEYGCGGTISRLTDLGHEVVLLYLNRGEGGIQGASASEAARTRTAEALQACQILKARAIFATQIDGQSVVDATHSGEFLRIFESEKPDVIITQWPIDNHPDHRAIASLVYEAWHAMIKSGKNRPDLFYYEVSNGEDTLMFTPDCYVDISHKDEIKHKACFAHASQAPEKFYSLQDQVAMFRGIESGYKKAEAYVRHIWSGPFPV
jgi:N-acetylglucosamine malate deacetylase 1